PDDVKQALRCIPLDSPAMSNAAMLTGEVQIIESQEEAPDRFRETRALGVRMGVHAAAAVPLLAGGRCLGVLVYGLDYPHRFSAEERDLLAEVGNLVAAAVERARLQEALARRAEEAELLHSIAL